MDSADDLDLATLESVSHDLGDQLAAVDDSDRGRATPCDGWDLTGVIDHVVGGNWFSSEVLSGHDADVAMARTMARFGDGNASIDAAVASVVAQFADFSRPGVLDATWSHVAGALTGRQMLRLRLHDLIVHTWDIRSTFDASAVVPARHVDWGLAELADPDSLASTHFGVADIDDQPQAATCPYLRTFGRRSMTHP